VRAVEVQVGTYRKEDSVLRLTSTVLFPVCGSVSAVAGYVVLLVITPLLQLQHTLTAHASLPASAAVGGQTVTTPTIRTCAPWLNVTPKAECVGAQKTGHEEAKRVHARTACPLLEEQTLHRSTKVA
jgi:hypothetical protein